MESRGEERGEKRKERNKHGLSRGEYSRPKSIVTLGCIPVFLHPLSQFAVLLPAVDQPMKLGGRGGGAAPPKADRGTYPDGGEEIFGRVIDRQGALVSSPVRHGHNCQQHIIVANRLMPFFD